MVTKEKIIEQILYLSTEFVNLIINELEQKLGRELANDEIEVVTNVVNVQLSINVNNARKYGED